MFMARANHLNARNCSRNQHVSWAIGGVFDQSSRIGREQTIALEMAVHDFCRTLHDVCSCPILHLKDSQGNSARSYYKGSEELLN